MAKITATFSDGTTDVYNGTRDVKAAWAIFEKETGKLVVSGHSLDVVRAQKTAEGYFTQWGTRYYTNTRCDRDFRAKHAFVKGMFKHLRKAGYTGEAKVTPAYDWMKSENARLRAEVAAKHRIEVVNL